MGYFGDWFGSYFGSWFDAITTGARRGCGTMETRSPSGVTQILCCDEDCEMPNPRVNKQSTLRVEIRDEDGELIAPGDITELRLWIRINKAARVAYLLSADQIEYVSDGVYDFRFIPQASQVGKWRIDWETEGDVIWSDGETFRVLPQLTA